MQDKGCWRCLFRWLQLQNHYAVRSLSFICIFYTFFPLCFTHQTTIWSASGQQPVDAEEDGRHVDRNLIGSAELLTGRPTQGPGQVSHVQVLCV